MTQSDSAVTVDMSAHYTVDGWGAGIAFYLVGYATEWTEEEWVYCGEGDEENEANHFYNEPEEIEDRQRVKAVMIGDDRVFTVDVEDLPLLDEEAFCRDCGQVGCGHNTYS